MVYAIYFASLFFCESGLQDISEVSKFAIDEESNHGRRSEKSVSFTDLHTCALCTVPLELYISRILVSESEHPAREIHENNPPPPPPWNIWHILWGAKKLVPAEYWCPYGTLHSTRHTVRAPVFGRHQFFGTSEHYGKAHGSLLSGWMNYNYIACCWFPTSSNILILPSQFWQIRFESCWFHS